MTVPKTGWKRNYFTIVSGQGISLITSGILQISIIFYLTEKTGSAWVLSLATLVGFLPQALLGPFIGVWVDRLNRKLVMIGADLLIALAGGVLAIIALVSELSVWAILLVLFVRSIGTAFHTPALSAITPLLVPEDKLVRCAGYSQAISSVGFIIAPAAGAFFYAIWPLTSIIVLDIAGAVMACMTVALVAIPKPTLSEAAVPKNFMREMKEGYQVLRANRGLFSLLWIGMLYMFLYMPISALFPLMSMHYFNGTPAHAAATEVAFAVGMLGGGLILGVWGGFKKKTRTICLSIFLMGAALVASGALPREGFILFVVCCMVMGLSAPLYGVQTALYQQRIKPEYLGRVFSISVSSMSVAMPLGLLFAGAFAEQIGVHVWFFISGLGIMALGMLAFLLPSIRAIDKNIV
ncbi:MAG: MFS transporter [Christensenellales bacterium]|jgi:DHA3 family macrolide efflux protein-like MFS transporter